MGGMAMSVWNHIRATRDVDVLIGIGTEEEARLLECLAQNGFHAISIPPVRPFGVFRLLQVAFEPPEAFVSIRADLLIVQSEYHRKALERRVSARLPYVDLPISVLSCEDLIIHKLLAGRIIDRADCVALFQQNRSDLDWLYFGHWIRTFKLQPAVMEVWQEAFPDIPIPTEITP
jgi:hypothetical protein